MIPPMHLGERQVLLHAVFLTKSSMSHGVSQNINGIQEWHDDDKQLDSKV